MASGLQYGALHAFIMARRHEEDEANMRNDSCIGIVVVAPIVMWPWQWAPGASIVGRGSSGVAAVIAGGDGMNGDLVLVNPTWYVRKGALHYSMLDKSQVDSGLIYCWWLCRLILVRVCEGILQQLLLQWTWYGGACGLPCGGLSSCICMAAYASAWWCQMGFSLGPPSNLEDANVAFSLVQSLYLKMLSRSWNCHVANFPNVIYKYG